MLQADSAAGMIFKNDAVLANLPFTGIGQMAVDRNGNIYLTDPQVSSRIFHIDQAGNLTVFADASKGLIAPYGLAIDSRNNVFVANNPGSSPAFILKFDPSGAVTSFATNISSQTIILSMAFDNGDNLYATLQNDNTILKFDRHGNSSVFATGSNRLEQSGCRHGGHLPCRWKRWKGREALFDGTINFLTFVDRHRQKQSERHF